MSHDTLLDQLVESPRLAMYRDRIDDVLRRERELRERFYETVDEGTKTEFINGEVIVSSPARFMHNQASTYLLTLLSGFVGRRGTGFVGFEKMMISLSRNDYEPDVSYWTAAKSDLFQPKQLRFPAPDFLAEVLSETTEHRDRGVKFDDYAAHGIGEYWIIDAEAQHIEQYVIEGQQYALKQKATSGTLTIRAIPGFEIPVRALFDVREFRAALRRADPA